MRLGFRGKLLFIVGTTALALALLIVIGTLIGQREARELADIEGRLLPKLTLGPQLEADFAELRHALQDAVAAQDTDALDGTRALAGQMRQRLVEARTILDRAAADTALARLEEYHQAGLDVSRRLIAGETGEPLVAAVASMQRKQSDAAAALRTASQVDRQDITRSFARARETRQAAARGRLAISLVCLAFVLALSIAASRAILRAITNLSAGFARFGRGDFSGRITVTGNDELAELAAEANQMAASLARLHAERDHIDWVKTGLGGLAEEVRGELEPAEVADRAVRFLAGYVGAPLGALYFNDGRGGFALLGRCGLDAGAEMPPTFRPGEGLVGQAALQPDLVEVTDIPAGYLRVRSGLGEGAPAAVLLAPLPHLGQVKGVLELASFRPLGAGARELVTLARETIVIALEVATARTVMREMLAESRRQADRLATQEQDLRANNEELQAQQEELRQINEELDHQRVALEEQNSELEEARQSLQQKAAELVTVSSYKSRFLANMSHELRTPLNSMLILSDLMARNEGHNLTDKQVEYCRTIYGAGKDLLALINQVLDLAKIEAGKQQVRIETVSVRNMVEHLGRMFEPQAAQKGLAFALEVDAGAPTTVTTDRQRLEQVLTNLLGNAIKFTNRGRVALHVQRPSPDARFRRGDLVPERTLALRVSDTGIGIAPQNQELIFAPFERIESATSRAGGTGLGLSIARELTTLLGGELHVDSLPGRGSVFTCYLPFEGPRLPASPSELPALSPAPPPATSSEGRDAQLLLVEDDPVFAEVLGGIIQSRGFRVLTARTGAEGLELARRHRPTGIILDVGLPDMDGWAVMDKLRTDAATAHIPVHFLSAVDAPERGWAMGAIGYLTKPASHTELVAMVQTLAPPPAKKLDRPRRVLVLEGDPSREDALTQQLGRAGIENQHAASAAAAFAALGKDPFVCLLLDLDLPDLDGLAFLEKLQEQAEHERPPVVVYTGRPLTKEETGRLEAYAEAVVLNEGRSTERLLDEVRLFVHHLEDQLPRPKRSAAARAGADERRFDHKRVLVVDDDMRTVYALSALLRTKGVDVVIADNGRAALQALDTEGRVDAVIMDVMMPEMDGYEAMRRIREQPRLKTLPVIALTAKAMRGERERCLAAGASDYLSKPIDNDELLGTLATWLAGGKREADGGQPS